MIETPAVFSTYATHLMETMEKNPESFLGILCWYTVPESVWVNYYDYTSKALIAKAPVVIKKAPKAADVFLRACTSVESSFRRIPKVQENQEESYINYLVRNAGSDADWICKQVVAETVDKNEHQISFDIVGDLRFNKKSHVIVDDRPDAPSGSYDINAHGLQVYSAEPSAIQGIFNFDELVTQIKAYYKEKEMLLTAYAVRESFRHALEGPLMALSVRSSGGIYFVGTNKFEGLAGLETLASELPGVGFHMLPLVDDNKQRTMIKEAFEDDAVGELEKLMGEIADTSKMSVKQLVSFQERFFEHRSRNKEYSSVLQDNLEKSQATLKLCNLAIKAAFEKIGEGV
jgi:hypothetical protein